jgi:CheY-like chemotaxis protein
MEALRALEAARTVELLITRMLFPDASRVCLARMARQKRPPIKIIFAALSDTEEFTEGLGEFIPYPVSIPNLVAAANRLLNANEPPRSL